MEIWFLDTRRYCGERAMDDKNRLTEEEMGQVSGGYNSDLFYDEKEKKGTFEPPKPEIRLQKDKLDDIPPSGQEYAKLPL